MNPLSYSPSILRFPTNTPTSVSRSFGRVPQPAIVEDPTQHTLTIRDRLLDPALHLSARRVLGLFTAGFSAAIAGHFVWKGLFSKQARSALKSAVETKNPLSHQPNVKTHFNLFQNYSEHPLYRLAVLDPKQTPVLLASMGTSVLGYLAGSLTQGTLETWVRRQETMIRAELIGRLPEVFRASLIKKHNMDKELKAQATQQIRQMLTDYHVPKALIEQMLMDDALVEPLTVLQQYPFVPITREVLFGAAQLVARNPFEIDVPTINRVNIEEPKPQHWVDIVILGTGALTGGLVSGMFKLLSLDPEKLASNAEHIRTQTALTNDSSSWLINLMNNRNRRNFAIFMGFLALSAMARVGKGVVDAIRQVEVTRHNARTEYFYQLHNWVVQDPNFHWAAETIGLKYELDPLQALLERTSSQLPTLTANSLLYSTLSNKVKSIRENMGRRSAPPYFPMTPMVGLVDARG